MEGWSRPRGRGLSRRGVGLPPGAGPFLAWVELSPGARSFQERGGAVSGGGAFPGERWSRSRGRGPAHRFGALSQEAEDARPRGEVILRGGRGLPEGRVQAHGVTWAAGVPRCVGAGPPSASPSWPITGAWSL